VSSAFKHAAPSRVTGDAQGADKVFSLDVLYVTS
jgi:hypothetical protein